MDSPLKKRFNCLLLLLGLCSPAVILGMNHSESIGVLSVSLAGGSEEAPSFTLFSPGVKASSIFRGPVKSVMENNVTFYKSSDLANPANLLGPLPAGVLSSNQARATAVLDENGSVSSINLIFAGSGYLDKPRVFISPPTSENANASAFRSAIVEAVCDTGYNQITEISVIEKGRGYAQPPTVTIDGGPHYLKVIDPDCNFTGLHFPIIANSDHVLELNNSADITSTDGVPSITEIFTPELLVEVVKGWTLGSLFGYTSQELILHADSNASKADWVYLLKEPAHQQRNLSDYVPHFHNGTDWKLVDSPSETTSHHFIAPDQSVIIARRADTNTSLSFNGTAPQVSTSWTLPEFNRTKLVSNPFPTQLNLSDLIGNDMITEDNSSSEENSSLWLANPHQEKADNVQILKSSGWSTYWHDGSNLSISEAAKISARAGSGLGGALTQSDFSMSSGNITTISNPSTGNAIVTTSEAHGLRNGFLVRISSVLGRLTNDSKEQINADGNVVDQGEGLVVESTVNGKWEITNVSTNTFALKDSRNNSDFLANGDAQWSTGSMGQGYDNNVSLSILGGGGFGARAVGLVDANGKISSISIIHGGLFYTYPPTVVVHPGGWRSLGRGNAPINNLTIPPGSGALLIRNHPHGVRSLIPLRSFLNE